MKFTFIKLINEKKTVNMALLPEEVNGKYTWQIGDNDVLEYDSKTKQFSLEVYEFIEDDYELVDTLNHEQAYKVALAEGIIYQ
jgi:hypothetical protein